MLQADQVVLSGSFPLTGAFNESPKSRAMQFPSIGNGLLGRVRADVLNCIRLNERLTGQLSEKQERASDLAYPLDAHTH